jgi:hypothetical protein
MFRDAMEARDVAAVVDSFAPDAVFHSPLTGRLAFTGPEQIGPLTEVVFEVFDDLRYTDEGSGEGTGYLVWRARVGRLDIESVDLLKFGPDGKIQEATAFFRPLPAAAAALRLIGAGLARRKSPARAAAVSVMAAPLAFLARTGDPVGVRLVS